MPELKKKEALEFTDLDEKTFENYFRIAGEFSALPRQNGRGPFKFDQEELRQWMEERKFRTISLNIEDYKRCLDFALAMHFRRYVPSDFGTGRQREFGQKITNWVKGQLGEIAVEKFFSNEFNTKVQLDFGIHDSIVPQDIVRILDRGELRDPQVGVGIKTSKPKNAYLILGENEINIAARRSDVYIFCRVDIPDDHLLRITDECIVRLVQNQEHYERYKESIPHFQDIPCEIAGYCEYSELERVESIPNQDFDGWRYVKKSGELRRTREEWRNLIERL